MKHIFIINPAAGKKDSRARVYAMAEKLKNDHGLDVECMLTRSPGHAMALTRGIAETGCPVRFYACGGDGTANEVANGIAGFPHAAMTCVPIGTGNDFLKNFGADAEKFTDPENLWNGDVQQIDLIDCNGRQCLTIACSGLDARIARDVHKFSAVPLLDGKGSYVFSLVVNFLFKSIASRWTVTVGDTELPEKDFAVVAVCNGRYYGGGFMPVGEARMNDGVLNTLVVRKVSRPAFLKFVTPYSHGEYAKFPKFAACYTALCVRIRSDKADIVTCMDGECITTSDVTIRLSDKKLNFFGPKGCDPNATAK